MKILIIKTSSLSDVVQMRPTIEDIRANFAQAQIDWVVEESRDPIATLFYKRTVPVPPDSSALDAYRLLAAGALNYTVRRPAVYGIAAPEVSLPFALSDA